MTDEELRKLGVEVAVEIMGHVYVNGIEDFEDGNPPSPYTVALKAVRAGKPQGVTP